MGKLRARPVIIFLLVLSVLVALVALLQFGGRAAPATTMLPPAAAVPAASHPVMTHPSTSVAVRPADPGAARVCGAADLAVDVDDPRALDARVGEMTRPMAARWIAAMQNSGDLRARAAGLLLEGKLTGTEPLRPQTQQTRAAIVQLAVGSTEPAVYAVALAMCGAYSEAPPETPCQQLSVRRWAQIDPANAVPWLLLAADAQHRHDAAQAADDFAHAAGASSVDYYGDSLYAIAAPELPPEVTPLARAYFATEVIGVEAAIIPPHYGVAGRFCSADAMRDGNVRQQCSALAELLVSRGMGLLDLSLGRLIGARAGWTSERIDELAQQRDALMEAVNELHPADESQSWTCASVARLNAYMEQRIRVGEVAAANDLLERSGARIPEMAQKYRQFMDDLQKSTGPQPQ